MPKNPSTPPDPDKPAQGGPGSTGDGSRARRRATSEGASRTLDEVREALRFHGGNMTAAGRVLGMTRQSVAGWVKRHPELEDVIAESLEEILDGAELVLRSAVLTERDWRAALALLERRGRHRGWGREPAAIVNVQQGPAQPAPGVDEWHESMQRRVAEIMAAEQKKDLH